MQMRGEFIMSGVSMGNLQREQENANQNRMLWIQHTTRVLYFSPMDGYEKKEFRSQEELMDYAKACVSSGYHIG